VAALERAPRHPEISRRIAEIDQRAGGRAEAALATLVEAEHRDAAHTGIVVAELLVEAGDIEAAIATFMRVGDAEPAPWLGARAFERASELSADDGEALEMLDRAMARAPRSGRLRWVRLRKRLAVGRLEDALADVEHLEAQVVGGRAKHIVWRRAGEAWSGAGFRAEASTMFERALRFVPDAPDALAGLGAALVAEGRAARGATILANAIELAESRGVPTDAMTIDLARALAEPMGDLPAAIARVRTVPQASGRAIEARGLEGRWRARLGDLGGASLAFARLRDLASSRVESGDRGERDEVARLAFDLLLEAATLERDEKVDLFAAQRYLACALRLRPHDATALRDYKDLGSRIARGPHAAVSIADAAPLTDAPPPLSHAASPFDLALEAASESESDDDSRDDPEAEARAADLTQKLQADPTRDDVVDELARLLRKLGRGHDLLALLCARLDDATPERRAELLGPTRAALEDLARDSERAGRMSEAALYRDTLAAMV
jgi:tetratricopeptide (TPR) repeat protein